MSQLLLGLHEASLRVSTFSRTRVELLLDVAALRRRPPFNERSDGSGRPKTKYFSATRIIAPALKRGWAARKSCDPLLECWICIYCITLLTH